MPTALITGASRGIGREFARQYAMAGFTVFAGMRSPDASPFTEQFQGDIIPLTLDVAKVAHFGQAARLIQNRGLKLDLLIHNAGIFAEGEEGIETLDADKMLLVYRVNVLAPALLTQALLPVLQTPGARVVALVSGAALLTPRTEGPGGQYSYGATKAALNKVLRNLHFDLSPRGVIVAGIGPGFVQTDMTRGSTALPPLTPGQSVTGMRRTLDALSPSDSGQFFSHDGSRCNWML